MQEITRVRYKKQENGTLTSSEMLAKEYVVIATIHSETMSWDIKSKEGKLLVNGFGKKLIDIKKEVKKNLKGVGVHFLDDVRPGDKLKDGDDLININEEEL